jgi:hypothetical protein
VAKKKESRLQLKIKKELIATVGGKWFKTHGGPFQEAGQPDLIGTVEGLFFGFEIKVPFEGSPSELQLETLAEWRDEGAVACIIERASQAIALVQAATTSPAKRCNDRGIYRWICATLRATHGEDMGYGRSARVVRRPRRADSWTEDQFRKYLGEIPEGKAATLYGMP